MSDGGPWVVVAHDERLDHRWSACLRNKQGADAYARGVERRGHRALLFPLSDAAAATAMREALEKIAQRAGDESCDAGDKCDMPECVALHDCWALARAALKGPGR